ncbi:MAG: 2OG-Fe(II) oxygenase family protein [Proteobacteria bacterium]|nr:2OG-Fe(II) oxygenase family protein [Pseudomonadota bacterium]
MKEININYKLDVKFMTPILLGSLENADSLNVELKSLFLSFEKNPDKHKNKNSFNTTFGALFDSNFDLFEYRQKPIQEIKAIFNKILKDWLKVVTDLEESNIETLNFQQHAWFHISRKSAFKSLHNHPNASWSLVYYIDPGEIDEDRRSGYIQIYDPRFGSNMHEDLSNFKMKREFSNSGISYKPQAGMFIVFPSYLYHDVLPYHGESPRINIASNYWIK